MSFKIACPMCKTEMGILARYCSYCGKRLPAPKNPPSIEEQLAFDRESCNALKHNQMKAYVFFCPVCGKRL